MSSQRRRETVDDSFRCRLPPRGLLKMFAVIIFTLLPGPRADSESRESLEEDVEGRGSVVGDPLSQALGSVGHNVLGKKQRSLTTEGVSRSKTFLPKT